MFTKFLRSIPTKGRNVVNGFLLALVLVAFLNVIWETYKEGRVANSTGVYDSPGGYSMTVCYFGPSFAFYLRQLILIALIVSFIGLYTKRLTGLPISLLGLFSVVWIYAYWWTRSFIIFEKFQGVKASEFPRLAYLYLANWWDVCIPVATLLLIILEVVLLIRNVKFEQRFP
jgi:hypothetical protein